MVSATRLNRRLQALKPALDDLPRQAKRLARWRQRREARPDPKFKSPLRPGRPPGYRRKPIHEVDDVLAECHWLAWEAMRPTQAEAALRCSAPENGITVFTEGGAMPDASLEPFGLSRVVVHQSRKETPMDKDRIEGSAKQVKGALKEAAGKLTGDAKLQADGKADKAAGKIQNAVGGVKDALRGK